MTQMKKKLYRKHVEVSGSVSGSSTNWAEKSLASPVDFFLWPKYCKASHFIDLLLLLAKV